MNGIGPSARLTGPAYQVGGKIVHYRDVLIFEAPLPWLGIERGLTKEQTRERMLAVFAGAISSARLVAGEAGPDKITAIVLEWQPDLHGPNESTLAEIELSFSGIVPFRNRSRTIKLAHKNEQIIDDREARFAARAQLEGRRRFVFHLSKIEVGLGDRLVGLASALVLAKALDAELFLDAPVMPELFETKAVTEPPGARAHYDLSWLDTQHAYTTVLRESDFSFLGTNANLIGNECFHYSLYGNPRIRSKLTNFEDDLRWAYREIFNSLLKPRPALEHELDAFLACAGGRRLIGLQLRSGMINGETPLLSEEEVRRICRTIADDIKKLGHDAVVFVTADNNTIAKLARSELSMRGVENISYDAPVLHISYPEHRENAQARMKLVVDLLALTRCDELYISLSSNFGRVGHFAGRSERTVGLYGRNFDFLACDPYQFSSKHLLFNDAVMSSIGGIFRFRYHGECGVFGLSGLVARGLFRWLAQIAAQSVTHRAWPRFQLSSLIASIYASERRIGR